jgi:glycosyltransferase involved in cell wall biosynthesis
MLKVSVILTTYNGERTIANTIQSILKQEGIGTEYELELLVIDDCSTDNTPKILDSFNIDVRVRPEVNSGGPNRGRNIGLKLATGTYICLVDHDDYWHPQKIKLQLEAAKLAPIIGCDYVLNNTQTSTRYPSLSSDNMIFYEKDETFLKKLSKAKKNVQAAYLSTLMIHNSLKNILFEEHFGMIDYDYVLRLFQNNCSVEVKLNLVSRQVDGSNLSLNPVYRRRDFYYSLLCLESYEDQYPRHVKKAVKRLHGSRARFFYLIGDMPKARHYFLRSPLGVIEILYYLTSFAGSSWVKKKFRIFG